MFITGGVNLVSCNFDLVGCTAMRNIPQSNPSVNYNWKLGSGPTPTPGTGPNVDHTLGTSAGTFNYMLITAYSVMTLVLA